MQCLELGSNHLNCNLLENSLSTENHPNKDIVAKRKSSCLPFKFKVFQQICFNHVAGVKSELTSSESDKRLSLLSTIPHVAMPRATTCCSVLPACNWKSLTASPTNSITPVLVPPVIIQAPKYDGNICNISLHCIDSLKLMSLSTFVFLHHGSLWKGYSPVLVATFINPLLKLVFSRDLR